MGFVASGTLQTATTVVKTSETVIGAAEDCSHHDTFTIFLDYTKGDETAIYIIPYAVDLDGDEYQWQTWTATAGDKLATNSRAKMTATGKFYLTFDVRAINKIKFYHQAEGGTPTGTLAAKWSMTGIS
jgi:hypothetical protein